MYLVYMIRFICCYCYFLFGDLYKYNDFRIMYRLSFLYVFVYEYKMI